MDVGPGSLPIQHPREYAKVKRDVSGNQADESGTPTSSMLLEVRNPQCLPHLSITSGEIPYGFFSCSMRGFRNGGGGSG